MLGVQKYFLPGLLSCAALLATPAAAQDSARDWYVSGAVTMSMLNDPDSVIHNAPTPGATLYITDVLDGTGWGAQLALGRRFGPVRAEAEIGTAHTGAKRYVVTAPIHNDLPQTGGDTVSRFMANAYYDVPLDGLGVQPYLGGGIGDASVHVATKASRPFGPPTVPTQLIDDHVGGFAWQAMVGLTVPVSESVSLTAQYRYLDAGTLHGHDTRGEEFQTAIGGHNIDLGVRFSF
jgi:opacity protein-like surface antigen